MKPGVDYPGISVVFMCHDGEGNFVMAKRSLECRDEKGKWDIGGGKLDLFKVVEDMVREEIRDEYCADALDMAFLGYRDAIREENGVKLHWLALDFLVRVDRKQVRIGEPHKFDDIGWFTPANRPADVHSQLPRFFELHKADLAKHGFDF